MDLHDAAYGILECESGRKVAEVAKPWQFPSSARVRGLVGRLTVLSGHGLVSGRRVHATPMPLARTDSRSDLIHTTSSEWEEPL